MAKRRPVFRAVSFHVSTTFSVDGCVAGGKLTTIPSRPVSTISEALRHDFMSALHCAEQVYRLAEMSSSSHGP